MAETNISPAMRAALGREIRRRVSYPVEASDIRKWAIAVYFPEPPPRAFIDLKDGDMIAPQEFNPFNWLCAHEEGVDLPASADNDPGRTEMMLGIDGPGLKFQLNGGLEAEYAAPIRLGDVITSVRRLSEYRERPGRLGLMLFTVTEDVWTNQRDELVKRTRATVIRY
jgi:hypothetical protein